MLNIVFLIAIFGCQGWTISQPILPSYAPRYQLVYLTPSYHTNQYIPQNVQHVQPTQQIIHNRVLSSDENIEDSVESSVEEEKFEISQFHSEDADGRIVFGFHSPDQIRMETRDADGSVRGSYSYIDPNGNVVKMQYWDDGNGFHAAGNNLPIAVHQTPDYTPEVKAAREHHLRLYEAALAALKAAAINEEENQKDDEGYIDSSNYEAGDEYEDAPPEGGVIIENPAPPSSLYSDSITPNQYPKVPFSQTNQLNNNKHYNDEDKESVSIDNPEFKKKTWTRKGKSQQGGVQQLPNKEIQNASKLDKKQPSVDSKTTAQTRMDNAVPSAVGEQSDQAGRAFFYHFTHTIPMRVERVDNAEEPKDVQPSVSAKAQQLGSIPVAAVHDAQVSPFLRDTQPNFQLYPVYHPERD